MARYVIDYFELSAPDTEAGRAFFGKAFGWQFNDFGPDYSEFADAGLAGGINADHADRRAAPILGILTDDIEAAAAAVEAAGGVVTKPVYAYPGGWRFFFTEPAGSEMMAYQPGEP